MIEIHVEMPDGTVWAVPANIVADDAAKYYSERNGGTFEQERKVTLEDDDELLDWASNNMDWSDVEKHAHCILSVEPDVDYQDGWINGNKTVKRSKPCQNLDTETITD